MRPRNELRRTNNLSRPYSSLKATRAAQIAKGTSVSEARLRASSHVVYGLNEADMIISHRPKMGELESRSLRVHTV